jgi:hypothetical protein
MDKQMIERLIEIYPFKPTKEIAEEFGMTLSQIYNKAYSMKLKKADDYLSTSSSGRLQPGSTLYRKSNGPYQKGNVPMNKGQKMSKDVFDKVKPTMFKKGNRPPNWKEPGTIEIRKDTNDYYYQYIKISDSNWEFLHRHIWEQTNGEIMKGHIIVFRDKNTMNCKIENLEMITRGENLKRNWLHNYPDEIKTLIKTKNKLINKIKNYGTK